MSDVTIWHNPRCAKSRQTLELLRARGVEPKIVEYLKARPSVDQLREVANKLSLKPRDMMRRKEAAWKERDLDNVRGDDDLFEAMFHEPILIERPIVFSEDSAVIGRPPEAVLAII
ncbi:MAG: arsenate reductase (glutaredoxin) [Nitratireductor sp.]